MNEQIIAFVRENGFLLAVLLGLLAAFVLLRTKGTQLASVSELDTLLAKGQPVVVEFFSNTWAPCLMAKPIVDGIEQDLGGRASVLRLNVMSEVGSQAAQRYSVQSVPTLIVFDGSGSVVEQSVGVPNRKQIVTYVLGLSG